MKYIKTHVYKFKFSQEIFYSFFNIKIINLGRIILLHCELSQHLGQIRLQYLGHKI